MFGYQDGCANASLVSSGYAQPAVYAIQEEYIFQPPQEVMQVLVVETVTILPNMTFGNATSHNATSNGTASSSSLSLGNSSLASSLSALVHHTPLYKPLYGDTVAVMPPLSTGP